MTGTYNGQKTLDAQNQESDAQYQRIQGLATLLNAMGVDLGSVNLPGEWQSGEIWYEAYPELFKKTSTDTTTTNGTSDTQETSGESETDSDGILARSEASTAISELPLGTQSTTTYVGDGVWATVANLPDGTTKTIKYRLE